MKIRTPQAPRPRSIRIVSIAADGRTVVCREHQGNSLGPALPTNLKADSISVGQNVRVIGNVETRDIPGTQHKATKLVVSRVL